MPLDEYNRKRNFSKTPEPEGKVASRRGRDKVLFFCVQKHLASHLHYDFRLEHDGVLLSWAVPKGPSLDPKTRRLAMQTEDHPFDYGEFEGVIPEGYGAGIVMLWDKGTWTPEVDDVEAALAKGDLKFTLDGYKLKGSWVLVRTKGQYPGARGGGGSDQRSWLLIKHRDDWSSADLDITAFAPRSVKSDGDFEDILAEDNPAVWVTNRPAQGGTTGAMLATIIERAAALRSSREAGTSARVSRPRSRARQASEEPPTPAHTGPAAKAAGLTGAKEAGASHGVAATTGAKKAGASRATRTPASAERSEGTTSRKSSATRRPAARKAR